MEASNLAELIERSSLECLNEDHSHGFATIWPDTGEVPPFFRSPSSSVSAAKALCSTSDDCQLLIKIGFRQPVKLSSLRIAPLDQDLSSAPRSVKLFINQLNLGFQDAESDSAVQELELTQEELQSGKPTPLRFVKFQNVSGLVIFVADNHGGDVTKIAGIEVIGSRGQKVDMKDWKPPTAEEKLAAED